MSLHDELAKAGVNDADVKRLARLLRKVEDPTAASIVRYIAGISTKKPPRGESWYYKAELVAALHDPRHLTDWDERIFELFATKDMELLLELRDWIRTQIAKYPDDDIAGNILGAAKKLDVYTNENLFHAITLLRYTNGKLNSGGRWLLARARDNYAKLVKAFPHKPGSDFTVLLAVEAPDLYEKYGAKLPSVSDADIEAARRKASGAPNAKPTAKRATLAKPKAGYAFDRYAASLVKAFTRDLDDDLTDIRALRVYVPQSRTLPELIIVETDEQHLYGTAKPAGALQVVGDGDDSLLEWLNQDLDEPLAWGDYYELPTTILYYELVRTAHHLGATLRAKNRLAKTAKVCLQIDDEDFENPGTFAKLAKSRFKKLPPAKREALAAACYADRAAASWLK
jgi:hypothetical protein